MEKLLHDRLREWADNYVGCCRFDGEGYCLQLPTDDAGNIANEIERDYIPRDQHEAEIKAIVEAQGWSGYSHGDPHHIMKVYADKHGMPMNDGESITQWLDRWFIKRPRFKDGEPVQFGDDVCFGRIQLGWPIDSIAFSDNGVCEVFGEGNSISIITSVEEFERPAPKVYDAEGVEIKVGDVVWTTVRYEKFTVISLNGADGTVECVDGAGKSWEILPSDLTHKEPDSLQKAIGELGELLNYPMLDHEKLDKVEDIHLRLTALIERGA